MKQTEDMQVSELADFIRRYEKERTILRRSLHMMESGVMHTGEGGVGLSLRGTTAESIARAKKDIAELEALLAKYQG
jgi:hypothetical protein